MGASLLLGCQRNSLPVHFRYSSGRRLLRTARETHARPRFGCTHSGANERYALHNARSSRQGEFLEKMEQNCTTFVAEVDKNLNERGKVIQGVLNEVGKAEPTALEMLHL